MKYMKYGVTLERLTAMDIEQVRQWRNEPVVVRNHAFREYITPAMQEKWFASVNNINNLYTIIEFKGEKIGVIDFKDINWEKKTFEGGIFIPFEKYHNTALPAIVTYLSGNIPFHILQAEKGYAHVLKNNARGQAFVRLLGYELSPGQENEENQEWSITPDLFNNRLSKLKKAVETMNEDRSPGRLIIERDEFDDLLVQQWEAKVRESKYLLNTEMTEKSRIYYFD
jgi:RimJ/RimL family protein N-acetyltransferase